MSIKQKKYLLTELQIIFIYVIGFLWGTVASLLSIILR